jgi:glycosyltransferase involved in cell wall biosynthesis
MLNKPTTLNVLHVVDSLERGGLERVVTDLARAQKVAGGSPRVFCLYRLGELAAELKAAGIGVVCGEKHHGLDLRALWRLRREIFNGCDVVHAHNLVPNYYCAIAMRAAWRTPALVGTCHDMGTRLFDPRLRNRYRWSVPYTQRFAMVADLVYANYVNRGLIPAERSQVIYNGIPVDRYLRGAGPRALARQRLNLPTDALVIGAVGRLVALKNHASLLHALPLLCADFPQLRLVLVGSGEMDAELKSIALASGITNRVVFTGERPDVAALLAAFDVFALPSITEGMSIALLEACAAALPIVATRVGGNAKIVQEGSTGLLVDAKDDAALRAALHTLLADGTRRQQLGAAAHQWVREHAAIEAMRDAYAALYQDARIALRRPNRRYSNQLPARS